MVKRADIEIRLLCRKDVPHSAAIARAEGWNQTESDWLALLRHSPEGCFAATSNGMPIGAVTTIRHGRKLAWIGMMLVQPEFRGRGVGKRLMRAALDHLLQAQTETVKLDATPAGLNLYNSLGFTAQLAIQRWELVSEILPQVDENSARQSVDQLRPAIHALDRMAFGANRSALADDLLDRRFIEATVATLSHTPVARGYGIARRGAVAFYLGPIVAREESVAVGVLDSLLGQLRGRRVFLDLLAHDEDRANFLVARGFALQRSLSRMSYGKLNSAATSRLIFSSAGPELG
jgi:predicted N-acetyltransferase YhbS